MVRSAFVKAINVGEEATGALENLIRNTINAVKEKP
jgi:hypothetical protein